MGEGTQLSPLAAARARRRLSVDEAAARSGLDREAIVALEDGRLYRFDDAHDAVRAALVYAGTLGIDRHEARRLAGLPVAPRPLERPGLARLVAGVAFTGVAAALTWFLVVPRFEPAAAEHLTAVPVSPAAAPQPAAPRPAPPPVERAAVRVDVLDGSRRPGAAAALAARVGELTYTVGDVSRARRRDYRYTRVYHSPGGKTVATRLAAELGVTTAALPGRIGPDRLIVIVGAREATDTSGR